MGWLQGLEPNLVGYSLRVFISGRLVSQEESSLVEPDPCVRVWLRETRKNLPCVERQTEPRPEPPRGIERAWLREATADLALGRRMRLELERHSGYMLLMG